MSSVALREPSSPCAFCEEFTSPRDRRSRVIWEDDRLIIVPTLGCFVAGYSLLLPKAHVDTFAELSASDLAATGELLRFVRDTIRIRFRSDVIVAEHGDASCAANRSTCEPHAHLHVIPCDSSSVRTAYEVVGGPAPHVFSNLNELRRWQSEPYILMSPEPDSYMLWPGNGAFGSKFVRRVCSAAHGLPDMYDWSLFPFNDLMQATRLTLAPALKFFGRASRG